MFFKGFVQTMWWPFLKDLFIFKGLLKDLFRQCGGLLKDLFRQCGGLLKDLFRQCCGLLKDLLTMWWPFKGFVQTMW